MEKEGNGSKEASSVELSKKNEKVLVDYLIAYSDKYPLDKLKQMAISRGYSASDFDKSFELAKLQKESVQNPVKTESFPKESKSFVWLPMKKEDLLEYQNKRKKIEKPFFMPTNFMQYALAIVLVVAFSISFASLNFGSLMSPSEDFVLEIGYPLKFINIAYQGENQEMFNFQFFVLDFLIYIVLAYLLDLIIMNSYLAIKKSMADKNKEEEAYPVVTETKIVEKPVVQEVVKTVEVEKLKEVPIFAESNINKSNRSVSFSLGRVSRGLSYSFVGSRVTGIYHTASCRIAKTIKNKSRIRGPSESFFRRLKYKPCVVCIKR
jgi:large-conductance mechanosensitive channel